MGPKDPIHSGHVLTDGGLRTQSLRMGPDPGEIFDFVAQGPYIMEGPEDPESTFGSWGDL